MPFQLLGEKRIGATHRIARRHDVEFVALPAWARIIEIVLRAVKLRD